MSGYLGECGSGCVIEGVKQTVLFKRDFTQAPAQDNFDEDYTVIFGSDGVVTFDNGGLNVNSNPFTATVPVGNEHVKWLRYYKNPIQIKSKGETIYKGVIAGKQHFLEDSSGNLVIPGDFSGRYRNAREDIRLCSAALNVLDQDNWNVYDWFISDEKIFPFYERLPFGWPGNGTANPDKLYGAFSSAGPPIQRTDDPENDFMHIAIGINPEENYVRWYVNGSVVFQIDRPGIHPSDEFRLLEHGGPPLLSIPNQIFIGFGTFSLLDMTLPNNYSRELVDAPFVDNQAASALVQLEVEEMYVEPLPGLEGEPRDLINPAVAFSVVLGQYPDDNLQVKLFGQGSTLRVTRVEVCHLKPCEVKC